MSDAHSIMLVSVVGMGYVGIPVAVRLAQSGANVIGIDIDEDKIKKINHGIYPIDGEEPEIRELLAQFVDSGNLRATSDYSDASESDAWLICVQTPFIVEDFEPNLSALKGALSCIGEVMKRGTLVVVESTIPPGTMEEVALPILESSSGLNSGSEFSLGHCPERVMPGKLLHNLINYDRALGGLDARSHEMMVSVYRRISEGKLNLVDLKTAEVVKTFENTYRDAEIAIANDFALYCDAVDVDFFEVRELVNVVESRNLHLPGGGVGGHCIPKDTWLLAYGSRDSYSPEFLIKAREVNDAMPTHVANKALEAATRLNLSFQDCKVAILGLSYLEESDDVRNSPSEILFEALTDAGMSVSVHDHFVKEHPSIPFSDNLDETISGSDILIVMVAHDLYKSMDLDDTKELMAGNHIIDARNVFGLSALKESGLEYYSIGRGSSFMEK